MNVTIGCFDVQDMAAKAPWVINEVKMIAGYIQVIHIISCFESNQSSFCILMFEVEVQRS